MPLRYVICTNMSNSFPHLLSISYSFHLCLFPSPCPLLMHFVSFPSRFKSFPISNVDYRRIVQTPKSAIAEGTMSKNQKVFVSSSRSDTINAKAIPSVPPTESREGVSGRSATDWGIGCYRYRLTLSRNSCSPVSADAVGQRDFALGWWKSTRCHRCVIARIVASLLPCRG